MPAIRKDDTPRVIVTLEADNRRNFSELITLMSQRIGATLTQTQCVNIALRDQLERERQAAEVQASK